MNKEALCVCSTSKKAWCKPEIKVVMLEATDIIATSDYSTQSYDAEEYNPWGNS